MMKLKLLLLALLLAALVGCGGGGGSSSDTDTTDTDTSDTDTSDSSEFVDYSDAIYAFDVAGAVGFYVTGEAATSTASRVSSFAASVSSDSGDAVDLDENSIYKINSDGSISKVSITDEDGDEIPGSAVTPSSITEINDSYLLVWLKLYTDASTEESIPYVVHKSTGLAYNALSLAKQLATDACYESYPDMEEAFEYAQWDGNNNIYIRVETDTGGTFYMLDTSTLGSSSITATELQTIDPVAWGGAWLVDNGGEFIVFEGESGNTKFLSIENESLTNIDALISGIANYVGHPFRDIDGKTYLISSDDDHTLYLLEADSDGAPVLTESGSTTFTATGPAADGGATIANDAAYIVGARGLDQCERYIVGGKLMFINLHYTTEVDTSTATTIGHQDVWDAFETWGITGYEVNDSEIYYFGTLADVNTDGVFIYNPVTQVGTTITPDSDYEIDEFELLSTGEILVEGYRLTDQAYFTGKLDEDGTITEYTVESIGDATVIQMVAINTTDFTLVDGNADWDWDDTFLILSDDTGDADTGADLVYYCEKESTSNYYGMIEYDGGIDENYGIIITFDNDYELTYADSTTELLDDSGGSLGAIYDVDGSLAVGTVVEFAIPISELGSASVVSVETFEAVTYGDVASVAYVTSGSDFVVTIEMDSAKGDAELEIQLNATYSLTLPADGSDYISDGSTTTYIADISGASVTYPATDGDDIVATIPQSSLDNATTLDLSFSSNAIIVNEQADWME